MKPPSIIIRIDDRLIHGQVLIGWGHHYPIKHFVVGNDEIARDEWSRNLIKLAAPDRDVKILTLEETHQYIEDHINDAEMSMILIKSIEDFDKLVSEDIPIKDINIGGIHYQEKRKEYLPYLFLDEREVQLLQKLIQRGYRFSCQDLPRNPATDLATLLEKKK